MSIDDQVRLERTRATCARAATLKWTCRGWTLLRGSRYEFRSPDGRTIVKGRPRPDPQDALADACSQLRSDRPAEFHEDELS